MRGRRAAPTALRFGVVPTNVQPDALPLTVRLLGSAHEIVVRIVCCHAFILLKHRKESHKAMRRKGDGSPLAKPERFN